MTFALVLALGACGAAPNPAPTEAPVAWQPEAARTAEAAAPGSAQPNAKPGATNSVAASNAAAATNTPAATRAQTPPTNAPAPSASAPNAARDTARPASGAQAGLVIANVAGQPVDASELLAQWMHHASADARDELDHLVLTRLVAAEAQRLGLVIPPAEVERKYTESVAELEKDLQKRRPGIVLDQYVDQALGLDPYTYRERMRADALNQLLAERVARSHVLTSEHALLRLIVVKTEATLKQVQDALAAGEAFEDVARRLSTDPSAKDGGRVPPVLRVDTVMGKLAFSTPIGGVSDPLYTQGAWLLARVDARPKPLAGTTWSEIQAGVEASLAARGIEELEFSQWRSAMFQRYKIDVSPFMRLAGEPVR